MASRRPILMPKLGLTMTEGTLLEWKVAPGDRVKAGDVIFIIETDKISNDIEADSDGVIEALHAAPGEVHNVGQALATLVVEEDDPGAEPVRGRIVATPLARRMAAQAGFDIAAAKGSGPRGRIVADDIAVAIDSRRRQVAAPSQSAGSVQVRPLGQYQMTAARRVVESKRDIPHFYISNEADVTALLAMRAQLNTEPGYIKLTVSHLIVAAVARALASTSQFNCVWMDSGLLELTQIDVGLAVESAKGVIVPLLRDLAAADIDEVARVATRSVEAAHAGSLRPEDLQGGAISISNVGMFGATCLLPIINPGQSSILGVGRCQSVFLPDEHGRPTLRQVLNLALSCDHRVIDGVLAARFLQKIQHALEAPAALLSRVGGGHKR
jgi:pyruvate dehydrogenase E2 component (dihydrolipoyllysine-residue acetyltransferase)